MTEALPDESLLRYSEVAYNVRVALLEIGMQWRAEQQWNAWINREKK